MKNFIVLAFGWAIIIFLVACTQATPTEMSSEVPPTQNPIGLPTALTQVPNSKSPTTPKTTPTYPPISTATMEILTTSDTSEPTLLPIPTLKAGQTIALTNLHMINETTGWGIESTGHIVRTTDSGQTWVDVTPPNLAAAAFGSFFLDGQSAWAYDYSNPTNGLANTINGGKIWSILTKSMPFLTEIAFFNQKDGWAETYDVGAGNAILTLYETHDSGATWSQIMITSPPDALSESPGTLHLCNICSDSFYYDPMRLIITYGDLASDPVGSVRLLISTDLGKTWKNLQLPMPDKKFVDGLVAPQLPVFYNDKDGFLPFGIIKYNPDGSYAYNVLAIYTTHDGGLSWNPNSTVVDNVQTMEGNHRVVDFVSSIDAFVACGNDLCVTHDGARTWQTLKSNLKFAFSEGNEYVQQFDFVSTTAGWAITNDGSNYALWKTTDGGKTWIELPPRIGNGQ